ncbi:restriction endonuclease [Streptomyces sp. NPDC006334]|uniref:restriction endonuclease n=1 Tax=Streptomyces sp. NPDC006334 TaxID=3156754 RepID=UPI0033B9BAF5
MTAPTRPLPPAPRRRFDLRSTALFFVILAILLSLAVLTARTAAAAAERRPGWAVALALLTAGVVVACRRGRRHWSARRMVRRTAAALEQAAETAAGELENTAPEPQPPAAECRRAEETLVPAVPPTVIPRQPGTEPTLLDPDQEPTVAAATVVDVVDYDALDPDEFEQAIADLCLRDGCTDVEVVGGAGDLGADVTAVAPSGHRLVIQCKRYGESHKVGSQDLQRFGGTCFTVHEADVAVIVTTSDFTAPAVEYAQQCGIVCVDARDLWAWGAGAGPRPWEPRPWETRAAEC